MENIILQNISHPGLLPLTPHPLRDLVIPIQYLQAQEIIKLPINQESMEEPNINCLSTEAWALGLLHMIREYPLQINLPKIKIVTQVNIF